MSKRSGDRSIQMEMALMPEDFERLYIDQAMVDIDIEDRNIFSAYTPWGIKQLESEFVNKIKDESNDPVKLEEEILDCIHLHSCIKENLILNLHMITERSHEKDKGIV